MATSVIYTHNVFLSIQNKDLVNWVFFSLAVLSILLTLLSGLIFLSFAYIFHLAHIQKSLFESGLIVDENTVDGRGGMIINDSSYGATTHMLDNDDYNRIQSQHYMRPMSQDDHSRNAIKQEDQSSIQIDIQ